MSKNLINSSWFGGGSPCSDADADAFLLAWGETDPTLVAGTCALFSTVKADGIYAKSFGMWPFAGSIVADQKWNMMDPRDLDAALRLIFTPGPNGFTHSITGAQMDTTSSQADTFLLSSSVLTESDCGLTVAVRSNVQNNQYAFGDQIGVGGIHILSRNNLVGGRVATSNFVGSAPANAAPEGVITITRSGTTVNCYKNGALEGGPTTVSGGTFSSATNIHFGMANTMEFCFGAIHQGLTATEVANFHTAIDTWSALFTGRKNW